LGRAARWQCQETVKAIQKNIPIFLQKGIYTLDDTR